ncbi:MFS transporter [Candidatus Roizmanbacteria bacterium CG_4_10_14_0_8_um_filter_39_9]|uniref:MFS transporter n=1 Tax=Candidatus Roizmanbacteria bacterium CG_4_10_14_0_8_um_filter_39_9 TaxID=1974829 RepID=A0A2M7QCW9_9BACT|nr:MAG: MFS transporter [Candidatus Roizmanbacteria bacterium CG_4_10_14_0_8_um_filter_39_9]
MKKSPFDVFRYRDFAIMWWGVFIAQIGFEMQMVAINWEMYSMTGSALSLGIIGLMRFAPVFLFSLISGMCADMFSKKKIMFISQFFMMLSSGLLFYLTITHALTPVLVFGIILIYSTALVFVGPSRQSMIPHLVPRPHFMQAVALNAMLWQTAQIIGPAVSGFIIGSFGVAPIFAISMCSFAAINIALLLIKPIPNMTHASSEFSLSAIKIGMRFVKRTPLIWSTMFLDFFASFFASSMTLMPIFAKNILHGGPQTLGLLYAAPSFGAIAAGLLFSSLGNVKRQGKILVVSVLIYGFATIAFGLSRSLPLSLFILLFSGVGDALSGIIRNTVRQMMTPDHLRGRMNSIMMIFYLGGPQLGEVEAGIAASLLGTPLSVVFGGVGTIFMTILMIKKVPQLLSYDSHEDIRLYNNKV